MLVRAWQHCTAVAVAGKQLMISKQDTIKLPVKSE
jgi:hypothetical protein